MRENIHTSTNSAAENYKRFRFFNWKKLLQFLLILLLMMALFGVAISGAIQNLASAIEDYFSTSSLVAPSATSESIAPTGTTGNSLQAPYLNFGGSRISTNFDACHILIIDEQGTLWALGENVDGRLGIGNTISQPFPVKVPTPDSVDFWIDAIPGRYHTTALASDGSIWAWGSNVHGQLGLDNDLSHSTPQKMPFPQGVTSWTEISVSWTSAYAKDQNGDLWSWGSNHWGHLGQGTVGATTTQAFPPDRVITPSGVTEWFDIVTRGHKNYAYDQVGNLWTWGENAAGILGIGPPILESQHTPVQVTYPTGIAEWANTVHAVRSAYATDHNGDPWVWGLNNQGQLGLGNTVNQLAPMKTTYPAGVTSWKAMTATHNSFIGIDQKGQLWSWGAGSVGELGLGATGPLPSSNPIHQFIPQEIPNPEGITGWTEIMAGLGFVLAVDNRGELWSWGQNNHGALSKGVLAATPNLQGVNTDNWIPQKLAPSLIPSTINDWASPDDATIPSNGAIDVLGDMVTIRFDREMNTNAPGTIAVIAAGGTRIEAQVAAGTWSSGSHPGQPDMTIPNSVFTAPIAILDSNTIHTAEVSGFRDALFNMEMYPHGFGSSHATPLYPYSDWSFTTGALPQLVEYIMPQGSNIRIEDTTQIQIQFRHPVNIFAGGTVTLVNTTPNSLLPEPPVTLNPASFQWANNNTTLVIAIPTIPQAFDLESATRYDIAVSNFQTMEGGLIDTDDPRNSGWFITEPGEGDLVIRKTLQMPEGTNTPDTTFVFDVIPFGVITARDDEADTRSIDTSRVGELPTLNAAEIPFSAVQAGTTSSGIKTVLGTTTNLLARVDWKASGQFVWRLKERSDTYNGDPASDTMYFDGKEFELTVIVQALPQPATGYHVASIELRELDGSGEPLSEKLDLSNLAFANTLIRKHSPANPLLNNGLTVSKTVMGDFADSNLYFDFDVIVSAPQLAIDFESAPIVYKAYIVDKDTGTVVTATENSALATGTDTYGAYIEFEPDNMQQVRLKTGEVLVFVDTHVGSKFTVMEYGVRTYTHRATLTLAGQRLPGELSAAEGANLNIAGPHLLGEQTNAADFTAYHRFVLPTRLAVATPKMMSMFIGVAVAMVLVILSLRHRRKIERLPLV